MKLYTEKSLKNFEFWSGAVYTAEQLTSEQLNTIEAILEELYPEGLTETEINDIFWFEEDWLAELLGYNNFEELVKANNDEDEDEDEDE